MTNSAMHAREVYMDLTLALCIIRIQYIVLGDYIKVNILVEMDVQLIWLTTVVSLYIPSRATDVSTEL